MVQDANTEASVNALGPSPSELVGKGGYRRGGSLFPHWVLGWIKIMSTSSCL